MVNARISGRYASERRTFREWRRSRPFWGGLLLAVAGLELLAIPLSGVLLAGQIKIVIYLGIGGVFGLLIGALLMTAGLVLFFNPANRVFYGIAGIVLGILSFPASNLGGLFLGMLLAIVGGALAFAWTPDTPGTPAEAGDTPPDPRRPVSSGSRLLAVAALPAVCVLGILCPSSNSRPAPAPSSSASPSGSASPGPSASGTLLPSPSPSGTGSSGRQPRPGGGAPAARNAKAKRAAPSGIDAPSAPTVLTADSAAMTEFDFAGVATVPVGGRNVRVLKFTASSAAMKDVRIATRQDGTTLETGSALLSFDNGMTLYATRLCGRVYGVTASLCFTPSTAGQVTLKLASVLGKAAPVTMTSITVNQFTAAASATRSGVLNIGV